MTIGDYKERYKSLSSAEVRQLAKENQEFRDVTETLYVSGFHQQLNKSCGDCYVDAYVMLMRIDEKDYNQQVKRQFDLLAGALLIDIDGDNEKMCSRANLTDELALYHLSKNPDNIELFGTYPENWCELVEAFKAPKKPKKK